LQVARPLNRPPQVVERRIVERDAHRHVVGVIADTPLVDRSPGVLGDERGVGDQLHPVARPRLRLAVGGARRAPALVLVRDELAAAPPQAINLPAQAPGF
jgi:hypothetical protein